MSEGKAKYKGILYKGREQIDGMVLITTYNENEAEGFEKEIYPDGHYIYFKYVARAELEELYEEREFGTWNDIEFVINGETEKTYTIWYWTKDEKDKNMCKLLGMKVYDKGIYVKEVPKTALTNYRVEKEDLLHK